MSHPFYWPNKYFFYPIGNTSAVVLTRDLPPEEPAAILILGCGDPRHVLYTVFSEQGPYRRLDFTCVDFEPAVLARNALLFSLVADKTPTFLTWNIFFHMHLDRESHETLTNQCKKLVSHSTSLETWRASPYSSFLRMSTEYTLSEIRRHWVLYVAFPDLPSRRKKAVRQAYRDVFKTERNNGRGFLSSARSAGILLFEAQRSSSEQLVNFWKTGMTTIDTKTIDEATFLNPTFAYSLAGEGAAVHYATDPLIPFHFASLFGNSHAPPSATDMVDAAKTQFSEWCSAASAFMESDSPTGRFRVRFLLAEVTAACRALRAFSTTETLNVGIPVAQFRTTLLRLDKTEYVEDRAPVSFNVIETSNLVDHIGLFNILVTAVPLMSPSPSTALYTESLLFRSEDATKEFSKLLYTDIGTMGLLLDLSPVDYLSGFSTRSNVHELLMHTPTSDKNRRKKDSQLLEKGIGQFHQVVTWKRPSSCDSILALHNARPRRPPVFDPRQLGTVLFDIYQAMFEQEDSRKFFNENIHNFGRAFATSNLIHYMRESFVLFLQVVRERLLIPKEEWLAVMDRLFDLEFHDTTMAMNTLSRNDFYASMHRQGVYTVQSFQFGNGRRVGRFAAWDSVPPIVRIVLSIPRAEVTQFEKLLDQTSVGTPPMQCHVAGVRSMNTFTSIHVGFGRVITVGTKNHPRILFEEDPEGRQGSFPLVVSFVMPSWLLTDVEPPHDLRVSLGVRSTTGTVPLIQKLGLSLEVCKAPLMDEEHVFVLPEPTFPSSNVADRADTPVLSPGASIYTQIGVQDDVTVELDEQCELVKVLVTRVNLKDTRVIQEFGAGAMPQISQASPCIARLVLSSRIQDVVFPFPIVGSQSRLRLARKSQYIEVVVPIAGPFLKPDGMKLNPFSVVGNGKVLFPWNMHRVALERLPVIDCATPNTKWGLNVIAGSMLSARERKMRKKSKEDALLFVKDSIHTITVLSAGAQGGTSCRVFSLRDEKTNNCDTVIFVSDLRYDHPSHSIVCDAYVLPLTRELLKKISQPFGNLVHSGDMTSVNVYEGEMEAWKQLLPALVERCRTWEHADNCEYLAKHQVPLTQTMEVEPICSCGSGKDTAGFVKVTAWRPFAQHVTRIALSPLFAVSYLETVGRDPEAHKCSVCRGKGKPRVMMCKGCQKVRYCSVACQKKDWPRHKPRCKA